MALKGLSLSETHKCLHQGGTGYTITDVNTQGSSSCYPLASSPKKKTKHNLFIWLTRPQPLVLSVCGVETQHNTTQGNQTCMLTSLCCLNVLLLLLLQGVILAVHLLQGFQECWRWPAASKQALCVKLPFNPPYLSSHADAHLHKQM